METSRVISAVRNQAVAKKSAGVALILGEFSRNKFGEVNAGTGAGIDFSVLEFAGRGSAVSFVKSVKVYWSSGGFVEELKEWKCEKLFVRSFLVKPVPCISPASVSPWVIFSCDSSSESPAVRNSAATQIQQRRKFSSNANSAVGHSATQIQ
ncbi:Development and cell death domain containing protein [Dorcoceras hygrometricum]|uniref:Development and cell death domain containing protein n=1 Tax=Dorcoceras hygrometricum TaxID=472368 RepID=A0A2Z7BD92_9LAMI|nr:Development and cell death domain containing protein [Dorcoceras hygrometricum]